MYLPSAPNTEVKEIDPHTSDVDPAAAYEHCEQIVLYFLDQPDFAVQNEEVGSHVRNQVGLTLEQWTRAAGHLIRDFGLITLSKSPNANGRPDTMNLQLEPLTDNPDGVPFASSSLVAKVHEALTRPKEVALDNAAPATKNTERKKKADKGTTKVEPPYPRLGYRMLEILAEVELAGGSFENGSPGEIAKLTGSRVAHDSYAKGFSALVKKGYLTAGYDLTDSGAELIEYAKAHPEFIPDPPNADIVKPSTGKVLDYINERACYEDAEGNRWLYSLLNEESILRDMANNVGMTYAAFTRLFHSMATAYNVVEVKHANTGKRGTNVVTNVRITEDGQIDLQKYLDSLNGNTMPTEAMFIEEDEAIELEIKTLECQIMAKKLGATSIAEELMNARDEKLVIEMTRQEYDTEQADIDELHTNLKATFVARYGDISPLAA